MCICSFWPNEGQDGLKPTSLFALADKIGIFFTLDMLINFPSYIKYIIETNALRKSVPLVDVPVRTNASVTQMSKRSLEVTVNAFCKHSRIERRR